MRHRNCFFFIPSFKSFCNARCARKIDRHRNRKIPHQNAYHNSMNQQFSLSMCVLVHNCAQTNVLLMKMKKKTPSYLPQMKKNFKNINPFKVKISCVIVHRFHDPATFAFPITHFPPFRPFVGVDDVRNTDAFFSVIKLISHLEIRVRFFGHNF